MTTTTSLPALDAWPDAITRYALEWTNLLGDDWLTADGLPEPWRTPPSPLTKEWYEAVKEVWPKQKGRIDPAWAIDLTAYLITLGCPHDRAHSLVESARQATRDLLGWFPGHPLGNGQRACLAYFTLIVSNAHSALVAIRDEASVLQRSQQLCPPPGPLPPPSQRLTSWCHEPTEARPTVFVHGPLRGQKQQLRAWVWHKRLNGRTFVKWCQRGRFWAVKRMETEYDLWFRDRADYDQACQRQLESESENHG